MHSKSKVVMILICVLAGFWMPYVGASLDVIMPTIAVKLSLSGNAYNGILLAGTLAAALCFLPIGHLSDRFGRKRLLLWGVILTMLSVIISGFAINMQMLILGNVLLSIGGAILYVNTVALGCGFFTKHGSGKIIGIISASIYAGRMLGPAFGGFFTVHFSWRWMFLSSALLGLIVLLLLTKVEEKLPEETDNHFDWIGLCIFSLGVIGVIYGFCMVSGSLYYVVFSIIGLILLILFVLWERHVPKPLLPLSLFHKNRKLTFSLVTIILCYATTYGVSTLGSLYLQYAIRVPPHYTGMMIAILPLMQCLFSPLGGHLVDRYQPRNVATCGILGLILGMTVLLQITNHTSVLLYTTALVILGISLAFIVSPNTQAVMTAMPQKYLSLGSSLVGEVRNIGESFSIGIINIILIMQIGYQTVGSLLQQELMNTLHLTAGCYLVIAVLAAIFSYSRGK